MAVGIGLARRFYEGGVRPLLGTVPHAAALLGDGSEVLGFDDSVSTDHDFGLRVQVFLAPETDPAPVHAALARLPERFDGLPVVFLYRDRSRHQVEVTTAGSFFTERLGVDPAAGMGVADWLLTPTQRLATLTAGAVFHDPEGWLERRRAALEWYPEDVWRYALAAGWLRIDQEEPFVGRTGGSGDDLGSAVLAARLTRDLIRLAFLIERRWAPYSKWLGRAFAALPLGGAIRPHLVAALQATGWREREAALCAAASLLGEATNRLGLGEPVDPAPRRFHSRDIRVVGAGRFTQALTEAITDPLVRAVLDAVGHRSDGTVCALPGTIDQAVDSVDLLAHPERCRAAAPALGL
jgi:hypothetical protein